MLTSWNYWQVESWKLKVETIEHIETDTKVENCWLVETIDKVKSWKSWNFLTIEIFEKSWNFLTIEIFEEVENVDKSWNCQNWILLPKFRLT